MLEKCKYLNIVDEHDKIVLLCKQYQKECVKFTICAFFITYYKEIS